MVGSSRNDIVKQMTPFDEDILYPGLLLGCRGHGGRRVIDCWTPAGLWYFIEKRAQV